MWSSARSSSTMSSASSVPDRRRRLLCGGSTSASSRASSSRYTGHPDPARARLFTLQPASMSLRRATSSSSAGPWRGSSEAELAEHRARTVSIVFQSRNLWPSLSARENVAVGLRLAGRRRGIGEDVERALDAFDCRHGRASERDRSPAASNNALPSRRLRRDRPRSFLPTSRRQSSTRVANKPSSRRCSASARNSEARSSSSRTPPRVADAADRVVELRDGATA